MTQRPPLSKAELEVARIVWELKEASVRMVFETFPAKRQADFSTVQTYLRRLEEKGYLKVRLDGRTKIFSPKVKPRTVIRETVSDLVDRLFAGDSMPLVKHLVEDKDLKPAQIQQLRELVDQLEEQSDDE